MRNKILIYIIILFILAQYPASSMETYIKNADVPTSAPHPVINEICYNTTDPLAAWIEIRFPAELYYLWANSSLQGSGDLSIYYPSETYYMPITDVNCILNLEIRPPQEYLSDPPHDSYIILCVNKENFTRYYSVPQDVPIYEFYYVTDSFISIENDSGTVDYVEMPDKNMGPLNHSWARYRGGCDTDNFTNDFYDDPYPTPGYENNLGKNPTNPSPPANLTATFSDLKVNLTWNPPVNDGNATITEYRIYRGTFPESLQLIASVNSSTLEYFDSDVSAGTTYYYSVSAVNPIEEGNLSEAVSIGIPENEVEPTPYPGVFWVIGATAFIVLMKRKKKGEW